MKLDPIKRKEKKEKKRPGISNLKNRLQYNNGDDDGIKCTVHYNLFNRELKKKKEKKKKES